MQYVICGKEFQALWPVTNPPTCKLELGHKGKHSDLAGDLSLVW